MRVAWKLFAVLTFFYAVLDVVYFLVGGEELGVIAIGLSALLALLIGYGAGLVFAAQVVQLPPKP